MGGGMSWQACAWADSLDCDTVDGIEFRVLVKLANVSNETGTIAYRSKADMAKELGRSQRTIQRALKNLELAALIKAGDQSPVQHIRADRRPTVYELNFRYRTEFGQPELDWNHGETELSTTRPRGDNYRHHGETAAVAQGTINKRSTSKRSSRTLAIADARAIVRVGECITGDPHRVRLDGLCADCWEHIGREAS